MKKKLEKLNNERLQKTILDMTEFLTDEQRQKLDTIVESCSMGQTQLEPRQLTTRMSQEYVDEKLEQIAIWQKQIDDGELVLDTEEYEDYSGGYWDNDWIVDYYDRQGIGNKLLSIIQFAKDCVDDRRYKEANALYEWLWAMEVRAESEYESECEPADLQTLVDKKLVKTNMEQIALLTLYAAYQVQEPGRRAEDIYQYFLIKSFQKLHIEDVFRVGRESLPDMEQFMQDWISLLKSRNGDMEARLLEESVLYCDGLDGLVRVADEDYSTHPSLYLTVMKEYDKEHDYEQMEKVGERAVERIDKHLIIRSETALRAAYAADHLGHGGKVMRFCWECFWSEPTVRNYLRLFGTQEMAQQYGMRGKEVLHTDIKGKSQDYINHIELHQNQIDDYQFHELCFYTGDFEEVRKASGNPKGSLGWSSSFIRHGIKLFLLYLYENPLPSKAAAVIADNIGFSDDVEQDKTLQFESEILKECRRDKTSLFWNYFRRWKQCFPIEEDERRKYLAWVEKIVFCRADAIVSGQHRNHYWTSAVLLAMVAEIQEQMGVPDAKREIYMQYKGKFPRHTSFQAEMKKYFNRI